MQIGGHIFMSGKILISITLVLLMTACQSVEKNIQIDTDKYVPINYVEIWSTGTGRSTQLIERNTNLVTYVFFINDRWVNSNKQQVERLKILAKNKIHDQKSHLIAFIGQDGNGKIIDSNAIFALKKIFPDVYENYNIDKYKVIIVTSILSNPLRFKARLEKYDEIELYLIDYGTYSNVPQQDYQLNSVLAFSNFTNDGCLEHEIGLHFNSAMIEKNEQIYNKECGFKDSIKTIVSDFSSNADLNNIIDLASKLLDTFGSILTRKN